MLSLLGSNMGLGRKVLNAITKHPILNGCLSAIATSPWARHLFSDQFEPNATYWDKIKWGIPPLTAFATISLATAITHCFTTEEEWRTRIGDYKIKRQLEERLKEQAPPSLPTTATQEVDYNIMNMYRNVFRPNIDKLAHEARKTKNPLFALDAAMHYFSSRQKYDEGLILLRDAFEWLGGKRPKLNLSARMSYFIQTVGFAIGRTFLPRKMDSYMLSAALDSILNPTNSWYHSQLGRMMADAIDSPHKKEMYVFHALLALAQNRSDKNEAFRDAFKLLHETCTPRRLGESRYPAWVVEDEEKNKKLFSGTFAFKGNEQRADLQNEWNAALTLEGILGEDAVAPQPLYLTDEPYNGLYVYVMRYLSGELLAKQLKRENKRGLGHVIPVLARILSRYPTEGLPRVDLEQKTYKKLGQLGMQDAMPLFKPVIDDLHAQPVWAVNKDAHPEQWQLLDSPYATAKVGVLDTDIREVQPAILDSANLLEYCGNFQPAERQALISQFAHCLQDEKITISGNNTALFRAHSNATMHRALCFIAAWNEKGRNKTQQEKEHVIKNAIRAVHDLKIDDPEYYLQHQQQYDKLPEFYSKLPT